MKSILLHSWRWPIFRPVILLSALVALPVRSAWAQAQDSRPAENPPPAAAGRGPGAAAPKAADGTESPIQLSPFEVNAAQDHGYFSPTTLAGTRLNNNIADLPSSISIVTKQLMLDTNSQNINDVFRYEANTEGASTYTPITLVRGNVADVLGNATDHVRRTRTRSARRRRPFRAARPERRDPPSARAAANGARA